MVGIKFITIQWTSENGEKAIEQKFSLENINFQLYQTSKELGLPDLDLLTAVASHKKHYESQIKELPDTVERELFLSISTKLG
ncbi:MAG: hypothetical protein LDL41_25130 [Coleofasciculus sp. S288]|nr:hypothetical protein [Coleofasciculus sp. S288]